MRRLWAIPILSLLLAFFCIYPLREVDAFCTNADVRLRQCMLLADTDLDRATEEARIVCQEFDRWQSRARIFLRHAEITPVCESMAELSAAMDIGDADEFYMACCRVQAHLIHLAEHERLSWGNLL